MRIGIIGAGLTGLTAAYKTSQKGHQVVIFEKKPFVGGLAAGFKKKHWQWTLDQFYHHLFTTDKAALQLIQELNLSSKFHFYQPDTSVQLDQEQIRLCTPFDLLRFPKLKLSAKIRMAAVLAFFKLNPLWRPLEVHLAYNWLQKAVGKKGFTMIWQPLLKGKFGRFAKQINLTWFWTRIKKRSRSLGYLDGGFQVLADKIASQVKRNGGQIFLKTPVQKITVLPGNQFQIEANNLPKRTPVPFDKVIVTCPLPIFLKITPQLPQNYAQKLAKLKFLSALTVILILKEKLSHAYWLNIVQNWPFLVLVEHTNLVNPRFFAHEHPVYLGIYGEKNTLKFKKKEELLKSWLPYLKKINPHFKRSWLKESYLFKEDYAQPVVGLNHFQKIPPIETPIKNLYLANQSQVYPYDRGINQTIELGEKVAEIAANS